MRRFAIVLRVPILDSPELELNGLVQPTGSVIRQHCSRACEQFGHMASVVECMMALGWSVSGSPRRPILTKDHESVERARAEVREAGFGSDVVNAIVEAPVDVAGAGV